ncbi:MULTISPECIES: hypothetical protein [unclassified Haladaptatus]|uniref:hypothetical protein n=1 Tax=unclassified Haladaptatus TaxID=2622732 RepID=UPI0023E7C8C8|nr:MULTISPECIES: hypothetical protein [unclassified Haladaptatus]
MSNSTQTATNAPRSSGLLATLAEHKLLSAFLVFELVLLVTGFVIGTIAGPAPPGETGLRHVAGLIGALAVIIGSLALSLVGTYTLIRRL